MKTKVILLTVVIAAAIAGGIFIFLGFKNASANDAVDVKKFMGNFCRYIAEANPDAVKGCFNMPRQPADVDSFISKKLKALQQPKLLAAK